MLLGPACAAAEWQVPGTPDIETRDMWFVCVWWGGEVSWWIK